MVDHKKVEQAIRLLLEGIGEDTEREGLKDTPDRIARMCMEIYGGLDEEADHHLVSVSTHFFPEDSAEIFLCATIYRTVIICQIEMCDSVIKCGKAHLFHILIIIYTTEIMP